jgi:hypothetical protein
MSLLYRFQRDIFTRFKTVLLSNPRIRTMAEGQPRLAPELTRIADNLVLDTKTDESVAVSTLWAEQTTVIFFLRRFG